MYLQLQSKRRFLDLHLTSGLHDWDMNEEIKLTTTTDQFYHDDKRTDQYLAQWHYARISRRSLPAAAAEAAHSSYQLPLSSREPDIEPNLWLMVNPSLACPIKYPSNYPKAPTPPKPTPQSALPRTTTPVLEHSLHPAILPDETCVNESTHETSLSSEYQFTDEDDASSVDVPVCRKVKGARKGRTPKASTRKLGLTQNRRLQRALQDSLNLKNGGWPRPPVNYCILIAMALSSSRNGSLNVQQIYNFTREHFPFFITAPDGWKNTIRHNLCFSNSFKKTPQQVSGDGKRKSCLWHLTLDGRQRLRDEINTLTGDSFRMLKRSMNYPDMIQALLVL
ncbi:forkhead box protein R1 [Carassius auratus]|uniref:Forkhead box protein R1 n=1 Tax=Carassius auratus TaxID=7957 RepID=A0A6P6K829_CARAU|nr:forkhead box protein N5-like [Carassius auratus]XP_052413505.1 forkhead box protein R1 [Carassius gibelio]